MGRSIMEVEVLHPVLLAGLDHVPRACNMVQTRAGLLLWRWRFFTSFSLFFLCLKTRQSYHGGIGSSRCSACRLGSRSSCLHGSNAYRVTMEVYVLHWASLSLFFLCLKTHHGGIGSSPRSACTLGSRSSCLHGNACRVTMEVEVLHVISLDFSCA